MNSSDVHKDDFRSGIVFAMLLLQVTNDCSAKGRAATVYQIFTCCHGSTSVTEIFRVFILKNKRKKITPNVLWDLDLGTLQKKQLRSAGQDYLSVICL